MFIALSMLSSSLRGSEMWYCASSTSRSYGAPRSIVPKSIDMLLRWSKHQTQNSSRY